MVLAKLAPYYKAIYRRFISLFSSHINCSDTQRHVDQWKSISSSGTSAATARGFRDDKCDHMHPGFDNAFATLNATAGQSTLIIHTDKNAGCEEPPCCSCICPQRGSAQSHLLPRPCTAGAFTQQSASRSETSKRPNNTETESTQTLLILS